MQAISTYAGHGQSNVFWSNHYNTWMFVYGGDWPDSEYLRFDGAEARRPLEQRGFDRWDLSHGQLRQPALLHCPAPRVRSERQDVARHLDRRERDPRRSNRVAVRVLVAIAFKTCGKRAAWRRPSPSWRSGSAGGSAS